MKPQIHTDEHRFKTGIILTGEIEINVFVRRLRREDFTTNYTNQGTNGHELFFSVFRRMGTKEDKFGRKEEGVFTTNHTNHANGREKNSGEGRNIESQGGLGENGLGRGGEGFEWEKVSGKMAGERHGKNDNAKWKEAG